MADQKVSALVDKATPVGADEVYIVEGGTTSKKASLANIFSALGGGGGAVSGTWDASPTGTPLVPDGTLDLASTSAIVDSDNQTLVPDGTASTLLGGAAYACAARSATELSILQSGNGYMRKRVPVYNAGDNLDLSVLGIIESADSFETALSKVSGIGITPGDSSYAVLLRIDAAAATGRNVSVLYCNNGTNGVAGVTAKAADDDDVYLRIDWSTRKVYVTVAANPEEDIGLTLAASAIGTSFAGTAALTFDAASTTFTPANYNFDLGDSSGGKTAMSSSTDASYPASPGGKLYEVSGDGTVDSQILAVGDIVAFNQAGDAFTILNNDPHPVLESALTITVPTDYGTLTEAYAAALEYARTGAASVTIAIDSSHTMTFPDDHLQIQGKDLSWLNITTIGTVDCDFTGLNTGHFLIFENCTLGYIAGTFNYSTGGSSGEGLLKMTSCRALALGLLSPEFTTTDMLGYSDIYDCDFAVLSATETGNVSASSFQTLGYKATYDNYFKTDATFIDTYASPNIRTTIADGSVVSLNLHGSKVNLGFDGTESEANLPIIEADAFSLENASKDGAVGSYLGFTRIGGSNNIGYRNLTIDEFSSFTLRSANADFRTSSAGHKLLTAGACSRFRIFDVNTDIGTIPTNLVEVAKGARVILEDLAIGSSVYSGAAVVYADGTKTTVNIPDDYGTLVTSGVSGDFADDNVITISASQSITIGEVGRTILVDTSSGDVTLTIEESCETANVANTRFIRSGVNDVIFADGTGVTLQSAAGNKKIDGDFEAATLSCIGGTLVLQGKLKA